MTIRIADIRAEWDRIKDAVAEACAPDRAEDAYASCKFGKSSLLLSDDGAGAIAHVKEDPFTGENVFWVWCAFGPPGSIERNLADLDELARQQGCTVMRHEAYRKAWDRIPGWKAKTTLYERRLT